MLILKACNYANRYDHVQFGNCALIQSTCALIQSTCALIQSTCTLIQSTCVLIQSTCALIQSTCALIQSACALIQSTCALIQSACACQKRACCESEGRGAESVPGCLLGDRCGAASLQTSLWQNMLLGCSWSKHGQGADSAWLFLSRVRKSVIHCTSFIVCMLSIHHRSRISSTQNHHLLNLFKNHCLFSSVQLIGTWL